MTEPSWQWIKEISVLAIHDAQISEHGGMNGIRDFSLLLSALAKPLNLDAYGSPDAADLAASYASGLVHNHPFFDGNKRTAWVIAEVFLLKHGYQLVADNQSGVKIMLAFSAGTISETDLSSWYRSHIIKNASE
jgi:death-on-curing protein